MTGMEELERAKEELLIIKGTGMKDILLPINYALHLINLAKFGQYYLNMRDLHEGPKADEFQEKALAQALEAGHIPTFGEYCKMMHEEAGK